METIIFEVIDKTGRNLRLTQKRWTHIREEHPEIVDPEELIKVITKPDKILASDRDDSVAWYFLYSKQRKEYLKVSAKYFTTMKETI
ncbi:hypothetical protein HYW75_03300 [Candidatus Pacearchaeota archaeon]|nr:hypothetical protein [Candidatus Pacearchaeota archaeon]